MNPCHEVVPVQNARRNRKSAEPKPYVPLLVAYGPTLAFRPPITPGRKHEAAPVLQDPQIDQEPSIARNQTFSGFVLYV